MHMSKRRIWDEAEIREIAKAYSTRNDFYTHARQAYAAASRRNILDDVCAHMTTERVEWDYRKALKIARQYKSRGSLAKASPGAYGWLNRNNLLDRACQHMPAHAGTRWTTEALQQEALKWPSSTEFRKGNRSAWVTAHKKGIMRELQYAG